MELFRWFFVLACIASVSLYEITIESLQPDPASDPTAFNLGTIRLSRKSRNSFRISGTYYMLRNLGNDARVVLEILQRDPISKSFNRLLLRKENPMCEYMDSERMFLPHLREVSNLPPAGVCPFPKINITVDDFEFNESMFPPIIPAGTYKLRSRVFEEERQIIGMEFVVSIR
ncbi:conserved hypothetical protein [Culex quinquefasciatus]|uniref:MD-2-related lipid-recognition domain-containing protein n=1 Tax=Culex quinquefasciatus TaxID=7176 RepID=B0XL01_CULQU|nr:uncharacterized protein LOC6054405 [Culex quinquefasciatus]EDS33061.1 conserved hypothetical protein [Culex quinquefasciatus]|eukprot:XP_001870323.1 conserved hypothetical protein [Culex quinquefasciatus]